MAETRNQEQMDADDALEGALQRVANAYEMPETGGELMLTEFLAIVYWAHVQEDRGTYHWFVNGRAIPRHHIQGLYQMLGRMLKMEFEQPDEEE
jgi:hypothetical protein